MIFFLFCCCSKGGMFVFQLFDYYACNGACILFLCVFETLSMGWVFGTYTDAVHVLTCFNFQTWKPMI